MREFLFSFQGVLVTISVLLVWLIVVSFLLFRTLQHYGRLTAGVAKKDLKSVLNEILKNVDGNKKGIVKLEKKSQSLEQDGKHHLQKIGFMRYNPFKATGGDQSFVLSLLDDDDNGLVITSLHSRETTRLYAKKVKEGGKEKHELSDEEKQVIKEAVKSRQTT